MRRHIFKRELLLNWLNMVLNFSFLQRNNRDTQRQFSENIRSEDDLRPRILGTFVVKFLAFLPLLGFPNI